MKARATLSTSCATNARPNGGNRPGLGLQYNPVNPLEFGRDFTCDQHPRQVAAVQPLVGPPIDQHEVVVADALLRGHGVGQRRPRPDGHNARKRRVFGPEQPKLVLQFVGRLFFGHFRPQRRPQHGKRLLRLPYGLAKPGDLFFVLDQPQLLDQARGGDDFQLRQLLGDLVAQSDGHRIALDPQPADPRGPHDPHDGLEHRHSRRADVQIHARTLLAQLGDVSRVAQHGFAVAAHQQIAVVAGKAGQIGDIGKIGDQQGIDSACRTICGAGRVGLENP